MKENNFFGKHNGVEPAPERWNHLVGKAADINLPPPPLRWRTTSNKKAEYAAGFDILLLAKTRIYSSLRPVLVLQWRSRF